MEGEIIVIACLSF